MNRNAVEKHFTTALQEDRTPVLVVDVHFSELVEPTISALRDALSAIGSDVSGEDVAAGMKIVAEVQVLAASSPSAASALNGARKRAQGVVLVHASSEPSSEAERVLQMANR
ncbi:hypothetical protein [Brachybacterium kimchii]|uniref:Uncharacterized protein n=1 Tax=Brachybacterium kimchii TaxID=2942909 RepID=A0ABY4NDS1_9MICO|nr:hypothetical protein [Brachybacterium kimchii]UQN31780.1 hypothetical protein M4486_19515 [Brachybacterium kimchii]